jgi:DNA ligase (NAD+)
VLLNHFKSLPAIAAASVEQMVAVHGVGEITAQELHKYFATHPQLLTDLAEVGVKAAAGELLAVPTSDAPPRTSDETSSDVAVSEKSIFVASQSDGDAALAAARSFCAGKSFVLTRAFVTVPRAEFSRILTSFGGQVKSQVTGATSYLIVGNAGKEVDGKKITEAQKRGTLILSESDLLQRLQIPEDWWKSQSK